MAYIPRLKEEYKNRVISALKEEYGHKRNASSKIEKIVLSKGVGAAVSDKKLIDYAVDELTKITGQKAVSTISKKDVASFKEKGCQLEQKLLCVEKVYEF
jgi:large subunit ribosomal protein L5